MESSVRDTYPLPEVAMAPSVLIVEDEAVVALATEMMLADFGFEVVGTVTNGSAAVETFARSQPDIVLIDINLRGGMDGCATSAALKAQGARVVFVTGQADIGTRKRAMQTDPAGYVIKPFTPDRLRRVIEDALR